MNKKFVISAAFMILSVITPALAETCVLPPVVSDPIYSRNPDNRDLLIFKTFEGIDIYLDMQSLENTRTWHSQYEESKSELNDWNNVLARAGLEAVNGRSRNCGYSYALRTLNDIENTLGRDAAYIKTWISNQAQVFEACETGPEPDTVELSRIADEPVRAESDRSYQQASFLFYKGGNENLQAARKAFQDIYKDKKNIHWEAAGYMVGRILRKQHNDVESYRWIESAQENQPGKDFAKLYKNYLFIAAYRSCAEEEGCLALNLSHLQFLKDSLVPATDRLHDIESYEDALYQLAFYLQQRPKAGEGWWFRASEESPRQRAYRELSMKDDFFDWMQAAYADNPLQRDWSIFHRWPEHERIYNQNLISHALKRWENGGGDKWLYIAAMHMDPKNADMPKVLAATEDLYRRYKCREDNGARLVSARLFSAITLMRLSAPLTESRINEIAAAYDPRLDFQWSSELVSNLTRLLVYEKRFDELKGVALKLVEIKKFNTPLFAAYTGLLENSENQQSFMDRHFADHDRKGWEVEPLSLYRADGLSVLQIIDFLERDVFDGRIRARMSRIGFVRSVLLNDSALFVRAAEQVAKADPMLKSEISALMRESGGNPRSWRVTYFLLNMPRFNISANLNNDSADNNFSQSEEARREAYRHVDRFHHNDNNWWCSFDPSGVKPAIAHDLARIVYPLRDVPLPENPFLDPAFYYDVSDELEILAKQPNGPRYLSTQSTMLANRVWADWSWPVKQWLVDNNIKLEGIPPVAEMLNRSVVTTRFGCNVDGSHAEYSRSAFKLLHEKFPNSEWTTKTPYWFSNPLRR